MSKPKADLRVGPADRRKRVARDGVLVLMHPVEVKNADGEVIETIAKLSFTRLNGKKMRASDAAKGEMGKTLALIAASAGIPPSAADLLDAEDITACGEILADFLGQSPPTGGK